MYIGKTVKTKKSRSRQDLYDIPQVCEYKKYFQICNISEQ